MTEEVAKIKANKDGTYIDIVPEKCVSAQKAQYDENGRDLLDAESSQTIKGANTFAAKQTFTGGVAISGTSAIAGNVNMDSGDVAIGAKVTASNTDNSLKVANHDSVLTSNDVLSAKDINTPNGDANNLLHRSGEAETISSQKIFTTTNRNAIICQVTGNADCISLECKSYDVTDGQSHWLPQINWKDKNGVLVCGFQIKTYPDGNTCFAVRVRNSDGSVKETNVVVGDVIKS